MDISFNLIDPLFISKIEKLIKILSILISPEIK